MASVLEEYIHYRRMTGSDDQPPEVSIASMGGLIKSQYIQPCILTVEETDSSRTHFELVPQRDSIAVLLYDRKKRQFPLVRRFRPALAASLVLQLPRNKGKIAGEVKWANCQKEVDYKMGWTVELCSGRVKSKKGNLNETALTVIEEQFGWRVDGKYLQHIGSFLTGVTDSGASCHLYYAELDCAVKISEGKIASNPTMQVYWMDLDKAEKVVSFDLDWLMPSSHFYAFLWFSTTKFQSAKETNMPMTSNDGVDTRIASSGMWRFRSIRGNGPLKGKWRLSAKSEGDKDRYPLMRLNYTINYRNASTRSSNKIRDVQLRRDSVAILIMDIDSAEIVLTKRFRPAVLVGRVLGLPENEISESADSSIDSNCFDPETESSPPHPISHLSIPPPSPLSSTVEKHDFSSYVRPMAFTFESENEGSGDPSLNWKAQPIGPNSFADHLTSPPSSSLPLPSALEQFNFSAYSNSWAYTYELASTRIEDAKHLERDARKVALHVLGYAITEKELNYMGKFLMGSSEGGESKYLFYAECRENHRVRNWKGKVAGVNRAKFPLSTYESFVQPSNSPPSVHIALNYMYNIDKIRMTERSKARAFSAAMEELSGTMAIEPTDKEKELEAIAWKVAMDGMGNEEEEDLNEEETTIDKRMESVLLDSIDSWNIVDREDKIVMKQNEEEKDVGEVVEDEEDEVKKGEEKAKDKENEINEEGKDWGEEGVDNKTDPMVELTSAPIECEMTDEERQKQFELADDYLQYY